MPQYGYCHVRLKDGRMLTFNFLGDWSGSCPDFDVTDAKVLNSITLERVWEPGRAP